MLIYKKRTEYITNENAAFMIFADNKNVTFGYIKTDGRFYFHNARLYSCKTTEKKHWDVNNKEIAKIYI